MSTVTNQAELDKALANKRIRTIVINSPEGVWLTIGDTANKEIEIRGRSTIQRVWGSATIQSVGGSATIQSVGGSATIQSVWGSATIQRVWGSATIQRVGGSATIQSVGDSATIQSVGDSATIQSVWDSATIQRVGGSSTLRMHGGRVESINSPHVQVFLYSGAADVEHGNVIDLRQLDLTPVDAWAAWRGAELDSDTLTVYKGVDDSLTSEHGVRYPIGGTVTAPDWRADHSCGGGLHFSASPAETLEYAPAATRYLECRVQVAEASTVGDDKIKARSCLVVREVDLAGNPVERDLAEAVS